MTKRWSFTKKAARTTTPPCDCSSAGSSRELTTGDKKKKQHKKDYPHFDQAEFLTASMKYMDPQMVISLLETYAMHVDGPNENFHDCLHILATSKPIKREHSHKRGSHKSTPIAVPVLANDNQKCPAA